MAGLSARTPIVSLVIPTYMRAIGVARALDSINEPYLDLAEVQVIVVDNASGDGTEDAVRERAARFPNLVFKQWDANIGPVPNWQRGIALAQAPWIKILWSDDQLMPRAIERMLAAAERNDARVVTCRVAVDYPDGHAVTRYLDRPTTLTPDVVASELLHFPAGLPSSPGAALIRADDAREALEFPLPGPCTQRAIGPDLLLTYWGVFAGGLGVHLPDVLARFWAGADSITVRTPRAQLSSCYGAALNAMIVRTPTNSVSTTTMRRLRSRSALDAMLKGEPEARLPERRLSMRATAYDTYQLTRHWFTTHILRRRAI